MDPVRANPAHPDVAVLLVSTPLLPVPIEDPSRRVVGVTGEHPDLMAMLGQLSGQDGRQQGTLRRVVLRDDQHTQGSTRRLLTSSRRSRSRVCGSRLRVSNTGFTRAYGAGQRAPTPVDPRVVPTVSALVFMVDTG